MAFSNTIITRFSWLSQIVPCCQARRGRSQNRAGWDQKILQHEGQGTSGQFNPLKPKTTRFYGMQPLPDPILSSIRSASPFSECESDYKTYSGSEKTSDHHTGTTVPCPPVMISEKPERILGELLVKVPEDEVCDDFLTPTAYLLSVSGRGKTILHESGITTTNLDGGIELVVEGGKQANSSIAAGSACESTSEESYTARFVLDDQNVGSQSALADFLKALSREGADDSTIATRSTRSTSNAEWVLQPLRPAPRKYVSRQSGITELNDGADTELAGSYGGSEIVQRRATLRRRDTGSTLELKLINIERTPSRNLRQRRQRGDPDAKPTAESHPNITIIPRAIIASNRHSPVQLPKRAVSISAVSRKRGEEKRLHTKRLTEREIHECSCGTSLLSQQVGNESGTTTSNSRVKSWIARQENYSRLAEHCSDDRESPVDGYHDPDLQESHSLEPLRTQSVLVEPPTPNPFVTKPSPAYPRDSNSNSSNDEHSLQSSHCPRCNQV